MPLLLEHCGFTLRSATITVGFLSVFFTGYRIIKESTEIVVLKGVEDDYPKDADVPKHSIPILLGVLYMGVSAACALLLCSGLMLFGVYKSKPNFLFLWVMVSSIYVVLDLSVIIYIGATYYDITLTRTLFLLSRDRWKYLHFAARRSLTHSPLHYIYMGRWYTVVLEEKLRKYGLKFKEVKSTTR